MPTTMPQHTPRTFAAGLLTALIAVASAGEADPGYPGWRGPEGSGAAIDSGVETVERFADGRFAWASEAENPLPHDWKGISRPLRMIGNGGYGQPVVAGGRVYVATFTPTGPEATIFWENVEADSPVVTKRIDADDTLTCIDAATGLTLWQTRIPESGLNFAAKMYAGHYIPCIAENKAVWVGCLGQMHCVDATTGDHLWTASTGGVAELDARYRAYCLDVGKVGGRGPNDRGFAEWKAEADAPMTPEENAGSRGFGWDSTVVITDGVAVANTRNGAAVAHDIESGEQLWRRPGALCATRGPLVWHGAAGPHIVTVSRQQIACLDPRTGAEAWTSPCGAGGNYNGHTPAISGDLLVATGPESDGFACWRLNADGAELLWQLPDVFASGYESPLIYRDHLWISRIRPKRLLKHWDDHAAHWPAAFTDAARQALYNDEGRVGFRNAMACVALESGRVTSVIGTPMLDHASLVAADGLLYMNTYGLTLVAADPQQPQILDRIDVQNIWCTSPAACNGRLYFRGTRKMVNCWDLRAGEEPLPARDPDWRNARIRLDLEGIRQPSSGHRVTRYRGGTAPMTPGTDLRLHLRTREGQIRQAWVTYPPEHADPEHAWIEDCTLNDGRLQGRLHIRAVALHYRPTIDVDLRAAQVSGNYADPDTGTTRNGPITGVASRVVQANATVALRLRREWNGGMNPGHQTYLDFRLEDGVGVDPQLRTRGKSEQTWTATFDRFDVTFADGVLTGDLALQVASNGHAKGGDYRVTFAAPVSCNRFSDSFRVWRNGEEVTPHNPVNRQIWGSMEPDANEALQPENALYEISLERALPRDKALRLFLEYRAGDLVSAKADSPDFCAAAHTLDTDAVRLDQGRLTGTVGVIVRTDGFVPLSDMPARYRIDCAMDADGTVTGEHNGIYGLRQPRKGTVSGVVLEGP